MESIGIAAVLDDKNFQQGLSRFTSGLNQMESGATKTSNILSSLGTVAQGALVVGLGAATAAFGAFVGASKVGLDNALAWGEQLDKLGDQFGTSGKEGAKWAAAFKHVGLSVEEGAFGLNTLTRGLQDTADLLKDPKAKPTAFSTALQTLGVKATDAKGKLKTFDQILPEIMEGFKKIPPGIKSSDLAMQLFGARGGSKFLDFLRLGKDGLKDADKLIKEFGLDVSTDGVNAMEDFGFAVNDLNLKFQGIWTQIGMQVLPIVRRFVDYVSANVLPVLNKFVQDNLPKLVAGFDKFVAFMQANVLPLIDRFRKAFDKGGIGGIIDQLGIELGNAFRGFDAAKILGNLGAALSTAWSTQIQPALAKWGGQFWGWLTGNGGAIEQVSAQLGKVAIEIQNWIKTNAPDWLKTFEAWKTSFWNWLADPKEGVISEISKRFSVVTDNIRAWSEDPNSQLKFIEIGQGIATTIIDGIAQLFGADPSQNGGNNAFFQLGISLGKAANNIDATLKAIGGGIAQGVIEGIASRFGASDYDAQVIAGEIIALLRKAVEFSLRLISGTLGSELGAALGANLMDAFRAKVMADFNDIMRIFGYIPPAPAPTPTGGGGTSDRLTIGTGIGGAIGGAGSSVSQPVTTTNTTARNVSVNFAPGSLAFSGAASSDIETIAQTIANRTVAAVLAAA